MALEEELMNAEANAEAKEEPVEATKNEEDPTDEEVEAIKEVMAMPWWEALKRLMKIRLEKQEKNIIVLAKDNCFNAKTEWFSFYEVLWAFMQGMGEMERLAKVVTADPEDIKKAQEAIQKAEAIMRWEKVEEK